MARDPKCSIHGPYSGYWNSGCPDCKSDRADQKRAREEANRDRKRAQEEAKSAHEQANRDRERAREEAQSRHRENQQRYEETNRSRERDQERSREEVQSRRWENQRSREDRPQRPRQLTEMKKFDIWEYKERERRANEEREAARAQEKKAQEEREAAEKERLEREAVAEREGQEKAEQERLVREAALREDKLNTIIRPALKKAEGWVEAYGEVEECTEIISLWRSMLTGDSWSLNDLIQYEKKFVDDQIIVNNAFARRVKQLELEVEEKKRKEEIEARFKEAKILMRDNKPDLALKALQMIIMLSSDADDYISKAAKDVDFKAHENCLAAFLSARRESYLDRLIRPAIIHANGLELNHGELEECSEIIARWRSMDNDISWGLNDIVSGVLAIESYLHQLVIDQKFVDDAYARRVKQIEAEKKERARQEQIHRANEAARAEEVRRQLFHKRIETVLKGVCLGLLVLVAVFIIFLCGTIYSQSHDGNGQQSSDKDSTEQRSRLDNKVGKSSNSDLDGLTHNDDLSDLDGISKKKTELDDLTTTRHLKRVERKLDAHIADDDEIITPAEGVKSVDSYQLVPGTVSIIIPPEDE